MSTGGVASRDFEINNQHTLVSCGSRTLRGREREREKSLLTINKRLTCICKTEQTRTQNRVSWLASSRTREIVQRDTTALHTAPALQRSSWARGCAVPDITERNMGQSLHLCFGSAGFCCWGLGMGRPFPHVKAWGGTAQITTQGHRGTFFRVVFRYLAIAALSFSGPLDHGKTTLMRRSLITKWGGPRSETTQLTSEVDRFLTGKSPKCLRL